MDAAILAEVFAKIKMARELLAEAEVLLPANTNYTTLKESGEYVFTPNVGHGINDLAYALKVETKGVQDLANVVTIVQNRMEAK